MLKEHKVCECYQGVAYGHPLITADVITGTAPSGGVPVNYGQPVLSQQPGYHHPADQQLNSAKPMVQ